MSTGGKGSKPRPLSIPRKQYDENWERIFGKRKNEKTRSARSSSSRSGSVG